MNLPCIVLRTSRFFPEDDDNKGMRDGFDSDNLKVNELLFRRVDLQDIVSAHVLAMEKAAKLGFDRFIISAPTPFRRQDVADLGRDTAATVKRYVPEFEQEYLRRGWKMFSSIGRVYDSSRARNLLGWRPEYTFSRAIRELSNDRDYQSELSRKVGVKRYHDQVFSNEP